MAVQGPPPGGAFSASKKPERRDTKNSRVISSDSPLAKHVKNLEASFSLLTSLAWQRLLISRALLQHNFNVETFIGDLTDNVIEESKSKSGGM